MFFLQLNIDLYREEMEETIVSSEDAARLADINAGTRVGDAVDLKAVWRIRNFEVQFGLSLTQKE